MKITRGTINRRRPGSVPNIPPPPAPPNRDLRDQGGTGYRGRKTAGDEIGECVGAVVLGMIFVVITFVVIMATRIGCSL